MGLIKAGSEAIKTTLADQWKEYFYCDSLEANVLVVKGKKRVTEGSSNTKGTDNIISNGSVIAVNEGQCMIIVEQGKVVDICAEAGEFIYNNDTEPSIFVGGLGKGIINTFKTIGKRFPTGGGVANDQRVYYFNTKEIVGNKYGTPSPVPFRVVDKNIGLDVDIAIRCNGEYSYKIVDPMLFYTNVCGNVQDKYIKETIESQLKTELLTALQPAFAKVSEMGVRYSSLPGHTMEFAEALNEILSKKWKETRGVEIVSIGVNSVNASEEDENMIKELQRRAVIGNPKMAAATIVEAQAEAMKSAASNTATGPMFAFAGMNMASKAGGIDANTLFSMDAEENKNGVAQAENTSEEEKETKSENKEQTSKEWTCKCGAKNTGKFCTECGSKKPATYKCNKCGWEPEDKTQPPKFCANCGDVFDENDEE